ncbi:MAG: ABC-2 family transporter protein [Patescibacteria group bacterium]
MKKYFKIFWRLGRMSLARDMMYPADFWTGSFAGIIFFLSQILLVWFLFKTSQSETIAGYNMWQIYFVYGVFNFIVSLAYVFLLNNSWSFTDGIIKGLLDLDLIKPINSFVALYMKEYEIAVEVMSVFISLFLIVWLFVGGRVELSWNQIIMILVVMIQSFGLYCILYIISSVIELFVSRFSVLRFMMHEFDVVTSYPRRMYPSVIRYVLLFIWPFFMIVSPIYDIFDQTIDFEKIFIWLGVNIIFLLVLILMWTSGLKKYCSAG